jgi:hypothetical protein
MNEDDERGGQRSGDTAGLWEADQRAVPPVIGRVDPETGRPSMRYDTGGEVTDDEVADDRSAGRSIVDNYETDDGASITISF